VLSFHPFPQAVVDISTYMIKGLFGNNMPMIVYPSPDNRIEFSYQDLRCHSPIFMDCISDLGQKRLYIVTFRFYEQLSLIFPDVLAQKIKTLINPGDMCFLLREGKTPIM